MFKKMLNRRISKMKNRNYNVDSNLTNPEIFSIISERLKMALRGSIKKIRLQSHTGHLFLGKKVKIKNPKLISIGKNCTIEDYCYIQALSKKGITIGDNFKLGRNSIIECTGVIEELGEKLTIGDNVGISSNAHIAVRGSISIGQDTIIGPNVSIQAENHNFSDDKIPIRLQGTNRKGIKIGKNCWIGSNVIILDGVTIGDGSVIGAGAVVTKNIEANSIAIGVPAKVIKRRI